MDVGPRGVWGGGGTAVHIGSSHGTNVVSPCETLSPSPPGPHGYLHKNIYEIWVKFFLKNGKFHSVFLK